MPPTVVAIITVLAVAALPAIAARRQTRLR